MLKKLLYIFVFVLVLLGTKQVEAVSVNDVISFQVGYCTNLIEVKVGEEWDAVAFDKVNADDIEVFKLGNNHRNGTEFMIKRKENLPVVMGVVKNGYGNVPASTYGITEENDFYLATKIAVNSAYLGHEIADDYRKMEILNYTKVPRAEAVIKAAEAMLKKGKESARSSENEMLELVLLNEEKNEETISRVYKVKTENVDFRGYKVSLTSDNEVEYKILDSVTGEEKNEFLEARDCFEVVIPNDKGGNIDLEVEARIHADRIFVGNDYISDYIVYSEQDEIVNLSDNFQVVHEEEPNEKPDGGSGETEEEGKGDDLDNKGENEDTEDSNVTEGSGNLDNEENGSGNDSNKGEEDNKEEGSSKPEDTKPDNEGENMEEEPEEKPEDENTNGEIIGDTDDKLDTNDDPNDKNNRRGR